MKPVKKLIEKIFNLVLPLIKPEIVQRFLRRAGFKFPYYRFAEKLNYRGLVDFTVNEKKLFMLSYNCPFEMFIFWFGIYGYWEPVQLKVWSHLVLDADYILDIGANNGIYTLIASTNPKARIFAFEPVPAVVSMLEKNVSLNLPNKIEVKPILVGDVVGESILYIPREGWVDVASLDKKFASGVYGIDTKLREFPCEMTTVDVVLSDLGRKTNERVLCKIDVEQAEHLVMVGMSKTLSAGNLLFVVELLSSENYSKVRSIVPDFYIVYAIDEISKSVYEVDSFTAGATNYIFSTIKSKFTI